MDRDRLVRPHFVTAVVVLAACLALAFSASCKKKEEKQAAKPPVPVLTGQAVKKTVPVLIQAIGNVEASTTVWVKAQITGQLMRVHFREGQDVKKGDLLFTIDPRPLEARVRQAEANLARSTAQLENAGREASQYEQLAQKGYVARDRYEQFRTNAAALEATVQADRAALENARLQLAYCRIHAPVSGRTGGLNVHEGNVVKDNADTPMVTIHRMQPVDVTFAVPEMQFTRIRRAMEGRTLTVHAASEDGGDGPAEGTLSFIDNAVDPATGTIRLKATFPNIDRRLWPGQFVTVTVRLSDIRDAVVVPTAAVQTGQQGRFVFVVTQEGTAELRPIETGVSMGSETVVSKGLIDGETVVTDGQMRLVPGAKIERKQQAGAKAAEQEGKADEKK